MNNPQYPDAVFNMRAIFYDRTKKASNVRQGGKAEPKDMRKLRKNFKLHQRPLTTGRDRS